MQRKLLSALTICTAAFMVGACGTNVALGLGALMVLFSVSLGLFALAMWGLSRFSTLSTDVLAALCMVMALSHLAVAWLSFEGGAGMAPPMAFALLGLPLVFQHSRHQMVAFGSILLCVGVLSWIDLAHSDWLQPYYGSSTDRALDVVISRMLGLLCCGVLLLRGTWLYVDSMARLRAAEQARVTLVEQQARAAAVRQAEELERVRSMSRGFAHDLSNLLAVMTNRAELLEEDLASGALDRHETLEDLTAIRTSAQAAVQLTRRLLQAPTTEAAGSGSFELVCVLREQGRLVAHLSPDVDVVVELPDLPLRIADGRAVVEQAVLNLCLNAIQAMRGQGRIVLRCTQQHNSACVEVSDDGPGIPPEVLSRIFEPHFTTRRDEGGTGLGLAMVCAGVESIGGTIDVDSVVGRGTRFTIRLPRAHDRRAKVA